MKDQPFVGWGLAVALCASLTAAARLDGTEEQSRQLYGEPLTPGADQFANQPVLAGAVNRTYTHRGWWVRSAFVAGKAVRLTYTKMDHKGGCTALAEDELQLVLAGEAGRGQWRERAPGPGVEQGPAVLRIQAREFVNTNGNRARLEVGHTVVLVETSTAAALEQRALAGARRAKAPRPKA